MLQQFLSQVQLLYDATTKAIEALTKALAALRSIQAWCAGVLQAAGKVPSAKSDREPEVDEGFGEKPLVVPASSTDLWGSGDSQWEEGDILVVDLSEGDGQEESLF